MTLGGGAMAIKGFSASSAAAATAAAAGATTVSKGSGLWKWGGIGMALSGLALAAVGFKAKGIETGKKATEAEAVAAINQLSQQYEATMANLQAEANAKIMQAQQSAQATAQQGAGPGAGGTAPGAGQQVDPATGQPIPGAAAQQGQVPGAPAIDPQTGEPIPGTAAPVGVGRDSTMVPGAGQQAGSSSGGTGQGAGTTPGSTTVPGAATVGTGGTWSPQALVGRSVNLAAGSSASGTVIAEPGNYRIEALAGDANGYATLDEANAAARQTMSTELMGSRFLRWMVVEHGGRFYGAVAKQMGGQDQASPLGPDIGNVVAWSAMNHVTDNGQNGWQAYAWSQAAGAQSMAVPYGSSAVFPGSGVGGSAAGAGAGAGTAPAGSSVVGGGPAVGPASPAASSFDPASQVGRSFSINASTTAEGDVVRGGALQVQKFVETSQGGFGTAEEAATAARAARSAAGGGDQWTRWVSLQGSDGRFYVYQGSIVKRETAALQNAAPLHVFGPNVAQYFDGTTSTWKALRDSA